MNNIPLEEPIKLFWTGGWDSTFRLLQIVLAERKLVQPYYILDRTRPSFPIELKTMEKIRDLFYLNYPFSKQLILPTIFAELSDLQEDQEISDAYFLSNNKKKLGIQYEWLARFCKENRISDMELCLERKRNPNDRRFAPFLEKVDHSTSFIFDPKLIDTSEYPLFKYYRFPIYGLTKSETEKIAKKNGWMRILKETWFCHTPIHGKIPCGTCAPCKIVISEKLGWRVPLYIRILNALSLTKPIRLFIHNILVKFNRG
jgi:hypothetical protein